MCFCLPTFHTSAAPVPLPKTDNYFRIVLVYNPDARFQTAFIRGLKGWQGCGMRKLRIEVEGMRIVALVGSDVRFVDIFFIQMT